MPGRASVLGKREQEFGSGRRTAEAAVLHGLFFFLDFDTERFEELEILIVDFEFGIGGESGDQGSLVGGFFALLAHADGGFEHQKNVVTAFFDAGDDFGDLFGIREGLVDGFAEFFHELLELLVHMVPRSPSAPNKNITAKSLDACGGGTV